MEENNENNQQETAVPAEKETSPPPPPQPQDLSYCVKCRGKREMKDVRQIINKRNIPMIQGNCVVCEKVMNTFIRKEPGEVKKTIKKKKPHREQEEKVTKAS
jgi:hypothetical protein